MSAVSKVLYAGLTVLFLFSMSLAQPRPNFQDRVDRWNDMWLNQNNIGDLGYDTRDQCDSTMVYGLELPGGSGQRYMGGAALWIGALIIEQGFETKRVSVGTDGWMNPAINELWPGSTDSIMESSRLDTVNCYGTPIQDAGALADHEFTATFTDTLRDPFYVADDPVDGPHRPLGIKVTRTTYSMLSSPCDHIYWIKYHIENIGTNFLKNLYVGMMVEGGVCAAPEDPWIGANDDLVGFDAQSGMAYRCDNDGRAASDSTGNNFTVTNVTGFCFLTPAEGNGNGRRVSFNWWVSNGDSSLDYGPAWQAYAERDSMGLGWTQSYGTPMGDEHKYDLMRNFELDFDEVRVADSAWIAAHPQNGQAWSRQGIPDNAFDIANGFYTRYLISQGPTGIYDYTDETGRRVYRLNPGEQFNVWMACVGGLNFHDPAHPQPNNRVIDPSLFDFTDLRAHVQTARNSSCVQWLGTSTPHLGAMPVDLSLLPVYPNPFNSTASIRFSLARETRVEIAVFDILGRKVDQIISGNFAAGNHSVLWNANGLSSGLYFVQARTGDHVRVVQKALLLK